MTTTLQLLLALAGSHPPFVAVDSPPPAPPDPQQLRAVRLTGGQTVSIDGTLDEALWQRAERVTGFTQRDPTQGAVPTESTVVYIAYDDAALYVGARLYDAHPDSIVARLSRRDVSASSDRFNVYIDPYHDRRSGFYFGLSAAGTQFDGTLLNDDWNDDTWDGVWEGKVSRDSLGWTAELRIPYSQLRFLKRPQQVWGINFNRAIARRNEQDYLVYTPKNGSGFVSRFEPTAVLRRVHEVVLLVAAGDRPIEVDPPHLLRSLQEPQLRIRNPQLRGPAERVPAHLPFPHAVPGIVVPVVVQQGTVELRPRRAQPEVEPAAAVVIGIDVNVEPVGAGGDVAARQPRDDRIRMSVVQSGAHVERRVVVGYEYHRALARRRALRRVPLQEPGDPIGTAPDRIVQDAVHRNGPRCPHGPHLLYGRRRRVHNGREPEAAAHQAEQDGYHGYL